MLPKLLNFKDADYYADIIAFCFWVILFGIVIYMKMAPFVFMMLFSLFVFTLVHFLLSKLRIEHRTFTSFIAVLILSGLFYMGYAGITYMVSDLAQFIKQSEQLIFDKLIEHNIEKELITNVGEVYTEAAQYLMQNLDIVKNAGGVILKAVLGIIFGVIIFYSKSFVGENDTSLSELAQRKIYNFSYLIFDVFRSIMTTQIIISVLNTLSISLFALLITYLYSGEFLPFWFIIIPFVTVFSLIPVVGNLIVNVLIALASLQVGIYYIFIALIYFFIVHKMELLVIGKFLHKKMNAPFILILFSMIVGELLFSSVVGIILGMVTLFSILSLLSTYKLKREPLYLKNGAKDVTNL